MFITKQLLEERGACSSHVIIFAREWPNGVETTLENLLRAVELGLSISWLAMFLPTKTEYSLMLTQAREDYSLVAIPAWTEYKRVVAPAAAEFDRAAAQVLAKLLPPTQS